MKKFFRKLVFFLLTGPAIMFIPSPVMNATTQRKTGKKQLREAIDSFLWHYDWLTGGTREETLRQADAGIVSLEAKAANVAALVANAGKLALADSHGMEYATRVVPEKLERYRNAYVGKYAAWKAEEEAKRAKEAAADEALFALNQRLEAALVPSNIIPFPSR